MNNRFRTFFFLLISIFFTACTSSPEIKLVDQKSLLNPKIKEHVFLQCMYQDDYFPDFLVDKCKYILLEFCQNLEHEKHTELLAVYKWSHISTQKLNDLQNEFGANNSEIETGARECLAEEFEFIAKAYGYENVDVEELIAPREW